MMSPFEWAISMITPSQTVLLFIGAYILAGVTVSIIHWMVDGKPKSIANIVQENIFWPFIAVGLLVVVFNAICSAKFWDKKILPARPKEVVRILVEGNDPPKKIPYSGAGSDDYI